MPCRKQMDAEVPGTMLSRSRIEVGRASLRQLAEFEQYGGGPTRFLCEVGAGHSLRQGRLFVDYIGSPGSDRRAPYAPQEAAGPLLGVSFAISVYNIDG